MADQIQVQYDTAAINLYVVIRNAAGQAYRADTTSFEAYSTANLTATKYAIALAEQGTASRYYTVAFPTAIGAGIYSVVIFLRAGANPAETDTPVAGGAMHWDGANIVPQFNIAPAIIVDAVTDVSPAAGSFKGSSALNGSTNDFYKNMVLVFKSGTLQGVSAKISAYTASTRLLTFTTAFPAAPANGDKFLILGHLE